MSRLAAASTWYAARLRELTALDEWAHARKDVPSSLRPLVEGLYDAQTFSRLKAMRADLDRLAIIRMWSGFEADFRKHLAELLVRQHPDAKTIAEVEDALPDSIEACIQIFRSLDKSFPGADKGWLDRLRGYRNDVLHDGFPDGPVPHDPEEVHRQLAMILRRFGA